MYTDAHMNVFTHLCTPIEDIVRHMCHTSVTPILRGRHCAGCAIHVYVYIHLHLCVCVYPQMRK